MGLIFSNTLEIKDKFTSTLNSFKNATKDSFSFFAKSQKEVNQETEKAKKTFEEYKRDVMLLTHEFKRAGMTMSEAMKKAYKEIDKSLYDMNKHSEKAKKGFKGMFNNTGVDNFIGKLGKVASGIVAIETAKKTFIKGVGDASEFQNASVFLDAVYGEQRGKEKYKFATDFANKTPFEEGEVANALGIAHSLGMKDDLNSFKMYSDLGSYAKLTNRGDLNSAIDAIADAQKNIWRYVANILGKYYNIIVNIINFKGVMYECHY